MSDKRTDRYAILIPRIAAETCDAFLFEVRSQNVRQPGEVCFPGGRIEDGETAVQAAVRETCEELGVTADQIEVLAESGQLVMGDGRVVYPVYARLNIDGTGSLVLSEGEVEEVFLISAAQLGEIEIKHFDLAETSDDELPDKLLRYLRHYGDYRKTGETDCIEYEGHVIWGLTARIIKQIIDDYL